VYNLIPSCFATYFLCAKAVLLLSLYSIGRKEEWWTWVQQRLTISRVVSSVACLFSSFSIFSLNSSSKACLCSRRSQSFLFLNWMTFMSISSCTKIFGGYDRMFKTLQIKSIGSDFYSGRMHWSKVTVKTIAILQKIQIFLFQINAVLSTHQRTLKKKTVSWFR